MRRARPPPLHPVKRLGATLPFQAFTFSSASLPAASSTGVGGDPHMLFPHGGKADYKGKNNTYYVTPPRFDLPAF